MTAWYLIFSIVNSQKLLYLNSGLSQTKHRSYLKVLLRKPTFMKNVIFKSYQRYLWSRLGTYYASIVWRNNNFIHLHTEFSIPIFLNFETIAVFEKLTLKKVEDSLNFVNQLSGMYLDRFLIISFSLVHSKREYNIVGHRFERSGSESP